MLGQLSIKTLIIEYVLAGLLAVVVSFFTGYFLVCLLIILSVLLFWHFYQLWRFSRWLWQNKGIDPPHATGSWFSISYGLYRMRVEQKKQKKRLLALINYLKNTANRVPDAIVLCKKTGHLVWCNKTAKILLRLKPARDKGLQIANLIRIPEFNAYFTEDQHDDPITLLRPSGKQIEFRMIHLTLEDSLLILARDIIQQYQLNSMRQNFFANVSHELRVPLTVIQGYVELLEKEDNTSNLSSDPLKKKAFSAIGIQIARLNELIEQLMHLTRIEASTAIDFNQKVDMAAIIETLYEAFDGINTQQYRIEVNVDHQLFAAGDADQLRTAISNLFYNAIEHNPEGSEITISWQQDKEDDAVFSIDDNGAGIAAEHIGHLTERFYKVDSSRSLKKGKSGLDLAIVKQVLNNHHILLHIESKVDISKKKHSVTRQSSRN